MALLVGWMRNAPNPQRRRRDPGMCGTVNLKTGKPYLAAGYAKATINYALTVVYGFMLSTSQRGRPERIGDEG